MSRRQSVFTPLFLTVFAVASQHPVSAATPSPLIASSVKLRVDHDNGHDWGTGTIIDTRQGLTVQQEALILTCGHIFRKSQGQGNVEVHLYGENSVIKVYGKCVYYDLEIDLALVRIAPPSPVHAIPIAPDNYQIQPSRQAWSVGCDHGGNPTVRTHQILSVDKVFRTLQGNRKPFYYVQVSGAPVGGRSGGGLFSAEGYLIGVCTTADPVVDDGHFVPPHIIRHVLDERGFAFIYQNQPPMELVALTPLAPIALIESTPLPPMAVAAEPAPMFAENRGGMNQTEQATLEEVTRRKQDGDEVIVIINSRNPGIPSDVIVLNGVSSQFLNALVNSPAQPFNPPHNPVIFSSHEAPAGTTGRQPVSYPVKY